MDTIGDVETQTNVTVTLCRVSNPPLEGEGEGVSLYNCDPSMGLLWCAAYFGLLIVCSAETAQQTAVLPSQ